MLSCGAECKRAIGSLLLFFRMLVLFTSAGIIFVVLGGMTEVLPVVKVFHQFTLPLVSYHREAVTGHKLLLFGKPVERASC